MQVRIIAVGKIKERFLTEGIAEYEKRLTPYLKLAIVEIADEKRGVHASAGQEQLTKDREGDRILAAIPEGAYVVALDVRGKEMSSEALAARLHDWQLAGTNSIAVIIGGDLGLSGCCARPCRSPALDLAHDLYPPDGADDHFRADLPGLPDQQRGTVP